MKEMRYQKSRTFDILAHGEYGGFQYWIVSMGTHPCAYIDATAISDRLDRYDGGSLAGSDVVPCHGGVTYDEDRLRNVWDEAFDGFEPGARRFVGWDYAHLGDYYEYPGEATSAFVNMMENSRKWTTGEILDEVKEAIDGIAKGDSK